MVVGCFLARSIAFLGVVRLRSKHKSTRSQTNIGRRWMDQAGTVYVMCDGGDLND